MAKSSAGNSEVLLGHHRHRKTNKFLVEPKMASVPKSCSSTKPKRQGVRKAPPRTPPRLSPATALTPRRETHLALHNFTAPLSTAPASKTFYFLSVRCTSGRADQWHRCWQSILGNVVANSKRRNGSSCVTSLLQFQHLGGGDKRISCREWSHEERPGNLKRNELSLGDDLKVLGLWNDTVSKQAFSLPRCRILGENPICSAGGTLRTSQHYKTKPTHGIGRYRHLVRVLEPKKKKAKVEVRAINLETDYDYGILNIHLTAYDLTLAESYGQYVHRLCNRLSIKVEKSYTMLNKTTEVMRLLDQGNKKVLDSVLSIRERVVQVNGLSTTFAEIFLEILQSNLPEGVRLSVREHTEEGFKGRCKARPELEERLAKLN
ncbi:39S ribosomal protein L48, mitochondrial-like [Acomys russatus]|uniref:39S ribosomal protein L48, mitochondrial-like n=1 Tax=Acomys russatus TaxID=60746 RepID=UPI0021E2785B|nr:39S ribosomal protein L48, mitochondrial-like [Acomys russatus]